MKWQAVVRFVGVDATPEWAEKKHDRQRAEWDSRVGARVMTAKYIGTANELDKWIQWYRTGPVTSVRVSDSWSEQR
jgi:hypothetical protein